MKSTFLHLLGDYMINKKRVITISVCGILISLLLILFIQAVAYGVISEDNACEVKSLTMVIQERLEGDESVTLPHSFVDLSARTPVILHLEFTPKEGDYLYIKSVYAPLEVYANDVLIYKYGQEGSYPKFMQDPATAVAIVPLVNTDKPIALRMEYLSPVARDVLRIHPVLLGSEMAITQTMGETLGVSFGLSLVQILIGILVSVMALFIMFFERKGIAFLWIGLFSMLTGIWTFGECNLTGLFIHNPTLLYLMAFCGLFMCAIPLLCFGLVVVDFHEKWLLRLLQFTALSLTVANCVALLLQILGVVALSKSMYVFHVLVPMALVLFAGSILYEGLRHKNKAARRFFLPIVTIALCSLLEVANYQLHFTNAFSHFFQIGVIIFVVMTVFIGGLLVRDALQVNRQKEKLMFEVGLMEIQIAQQKQHQYFLLENAETMKAQRHDMRHQIAVIRRYSEHEETSKLIEYLDTLVAEIPLEQNEVYCKNAAVNAIVSHYSGLGVKKGIDVSIHLTIPENLEQISDSSLCVIFGNLMENAIEACNRMGEGHKFIRLNSRMQYKTLTIAIDNSFDGNFKIQDGKLRSTKRFDYGTGTASITAMAKKHGGGASFDVDGRVFQSSVYIRV